MAKKTPFESEIGKMLSGMYPFVHRIMDVMGKRFISKKPADFVACDWNGTFIILEAKSTRTGMFEFVKIPSHQREALTTIANTKHGTAVLALNLRGKRNPGKAWMIPWDFWSSWEKLWPKKSIRLDEAVEQFGRFELKRITGGWSQP